MQDDEFEWDDAKAAKNQARHGVSFELARAAFRDPFAIEFLDDRLNYGEERFVLIAMVAGRLLSVTHTERAGRNRLISARPATRQEQDDYLRQDT